MPPSISEQGLFLFSTVFPPPHRVPLLLLGHQRHERRGGGLPGLVRADGCHRPLRALDQQGGEHVPGSLHQLLLRVEEAARAHKVAPLQRGDGPVDELM